MDGSQRADIEAQVKVIKERMPQTYRSIQAKAQQIGRGAFALVRRSIAGEPNLFWAMEGGHVVGTPFARDQPIADDVAKLMVLFGCRVVVMWSEVAVKVDHGAH